MNSALTKSAWVCSGNRRPSASDAGSSGLSPAAIASDSPGRIRTTRPVGRPRRRSAISRYSALAGSSTSHGIPAQAAASSSARMVCDFPEPVAPQTNACRLSEPSGSTSRPAGRRSRSSTSPTVIASRSGADSRAPDSWAPSSWVTSKSGPDISRTRGSRARAAGPAPRRARCWPPAVSRVPRRRPATPGRVCEQLAQADGRAAEEGRWRRAARSGRPRRTPGRPPATRHRGRCRRPQAHPP